METKREPRLINMDEHNGWGDCISFYDWDRREIDGHMDPMPDAGDYLTKKMKSGKTALFKIIEIKACSDPHDQFFGTVTDLGYIEDIQKALIDFGKALQEAFKPVCEALGDLVNNEDFRKSFLEYEKAKKEEEEEKHV